MFIPLPSRGHDDGAAPQCSSLMPLGFSERFRIIHFEKVSFLTKNAFSQISPSRNAQKSTSRPTLEVFPMPNRIKKPRLTHW